jgi:hypothetical protein
VEGLRVAFAGHIRSEDLGSPAAAAGQIREALGLLDTRRGVLLVGLAEGADALALAAWSDLGLGEVHAVLPYLETAPPADLAAIVSRVTWLDGAAAEAAGRNAHLAQTRWLLEDADLLVVAWTGEEARGAGGTADAVRVALQRGMPVMWIKPGDRGPPRIISPAALETDFGFLELVEQLRRETPPLVIPAEAADLAALLGVASVAAEPAPPPTRPALLGLWERLLDRTVWRTFAVYRRWIGGRPEAGHVPTPLPESLNAQPGFQLLTHAYEAYDARATRLAAVHRSQQVFQALMMILAVAVGASPAVLPGIKIYAVIGELVLALVTFLVWASAVRSERGRRWGEARRAAEQLHLERAAWALGLSTRDDRRFVTGGAAARLACAWRRRAGAPDGPFDRTRVAAWGGWALDDLLYGQIAYHRIQGHLNHRLSHRGHTIENAVFWFLVLLLTAFAAAYGFAHHRHEHLPHWFGGLVLLAGAVTPAFGAASLALDASLAFSDQARRSDVLRRGLEAVADGLDPGAPLETLQRAARAAIRLRVSQEESWSDEAAHRHVVRGG